MTALWERRRRREWSGYQGRGRLLVVGAGGELDHLERLLDDRDVTGREVVHLAGGDHLVVVGVLEPHPAFDDIAPVRTLAMAFWQLGGEELGRVTDGNVLDGDDEVAPVRLSAGK